LFYLVPFENLLITEDYKKYVSKDAFLKLQNFQTGLWITCNENFENNSFIKSNGNTSSQVALTALGNIFLK